MDAQLLRARAQQPPSTDGRFARRIAQARAAPEHAARGAAGNAGAFRRALSGGGAHRGVVHGIAAPPRRARARSTDAQPRAAHTRTVATGVQGGGVGGSVGGSANGET